jgi:hypothetical protein
VPTARRQASEVFAAIETALRPYVGATMARTAAAAHAQRLGLGGPHLDDEQVGKLLGKLALGLMILVGEERTQSVVASMRRAIEGLEVLP